MTCHIERELDGKNLGCIGFPLNPDIAYEWDVPYDPIWIGQKLKGELVATRVSNSVVADVVKNQTLNFFVYIDISEIKITRRLEWQMTKSSHFHSFY